MKNTVNIINIKRVISTTVLRTFARNDKSVAFWLGARNDKNGKNALFIFNKIRERYWLSGKLFCKVLYFSVGCLIS